MNSLRAERQNGVGPRFNAAIGHAGEMDAQEGKAWIGHGVDEVLHEKSALGNQLVILTPERNDQQAWIQSTQARHAIGMQAAAIDEVLGVNFPLA